MIPTAEDVLKKHLIKYIQEGRVSTDDRASAVNDAMLEHTKLHVEAALKTASENATAEMERDLAGGKWLVVDKNSIINSYPLENIQ